MRRGLGCIVVLAFCAFSARSQAREQYPAKVHDAVKMECTPGCGLCHIDPNGGGERNQWGAERWGLATASNAIELLRMQMNPDYDHDGKDDVAELQAGENPGVPGASSVCIPEYGCGARLARTPAPPGPISGALAAGLLVFTLRWRRAARVRARA
jgi:hypothetical protein